MTQPLASTPVKPGTASTRFNRDATGLAATKDRAVPRHPRGSGVEAGQAPAKGWGRLGLVLAGTGMAATADLLARTFTLIAPGRHPALDVCSALFSASCDGTLADPRSWVL